VAVESAIEEAMARGKPWIGYWCEPFIWHVKKDFTLSEDNPGIPPHIRMNANTCANSRSAIKSLP
jgi:hypothetical protein